MKSGLVSFIGIGSTGSFSCSPGTLLSSGTYMLYISMLG